MADASKPSKNDKKRHFLRRYEALKDYQKTADGYVYVGSWYDCGQSLPVFKHRAAFGLIFAALALFSTLSFGLLPYASKTQFFLPGTKIPLLFSAFVLLPWAVSLILQCPLAARAFRLFREGPALKAYIYRQTVVSLPGFTAGSSLFLALSLLFFLWDTFRKTSGLSGLQTLLATVSFLLALMFLQLSRRVLSKLTFSPRSE